MLLVYKGQLLLFIWCFLVVVGGLFVILLFFGFCKKKQKWPYKKVPIMSEIEKKFYKQLLFVFPLYHIFVQVQLSRIIRPPKGKKELQWLNKIWRLSLDYVIVDKEFNTIAVIELDDASHSLPRRKEIDLRKDKALKAAGIHLIRIKTKHLPSNNSLLSLVNR